MNLRLRLAVIAQAVVAVLLIASCAQVAVAPIPTSTTPPTSTPRPTTPATTTVDISTESLPPTDAEWTARLTRSLSLIPGHYSPIIFLDVKAVLANTVIQQALNLEILGLLDTLQPGASASVDSVVVAISRDGSGLVTVIRGALDVDGLLVAAGGLGIVTSGQEPEKHRDHVVRSVDVFGISLALASADESTLVIATGPPSGGASGIEQIRAALDSFDGLAPGSLDDPETAQLVSRLPAGVTAVVLGECDNLTVLFSLDTLRGCTGAAISAEVAESGAGTINAIVGYEDEALSAAAMGLMRQQGFQLDGLTLEKTAVVRDGAHLGIRLPANVDQVALAFDALRVP